MMIIYGMYNIILEINVLHFRLSTIQQGGGFGGFHLAQSIFKVGVVYLSS